MSAHCCEHESPAPGQIVNLGRYRRILWVALLANATMLLVELGAGVSSGSLSLMADAMDFAGDALNYGVSLAVLASALAWRARAAVLKALSMIGFGLYIVASALWAAWNGLVPDAPTMGVVAVLALLTNMGVAWLLYAYREGDANMRSVWLCTRNDAIGNVAVLLAAVGVFGTGTAWPDLLVATLLASLALLGGFQVLRQARQELKVSASGKSAPKRVDHTPEAEQEVPFEPHTFEQLRLAYDQWVDRDVAQAWHLLEAMHVVGQTRIVPHARTHWLMLKLALRTRNMSEFNGQILRLLLVPLGHLLKRLPLGNSGRASISAFKPMRVSPELLTTIRRYRLADWVS